VIKARDRAELKVALAANAQIAGVVKALLSDIKQGSFVGVTAMPKADGSQSALEVHIFPEAMRGTGEGHYPWDLQPQSTMTNANVEQAVSAVDGQTLTLKYKDGERKIFVPANTPIVVYVQGDKSDLKPGAKVFIAAIKQPDGTLQGRAWRVGRDASAAPRAQFAIANEVIESGWPTSDPGTFWTCADEVRRSAYGSKAVLSRI
jgi:hypothetical protein